MSSCSDLSLNLSLSLFLYSSLSITFCYYFHISRDNGPRYLLIICLSLWIVIRINVMEEEIVIVIRISHPCIMLVLVENMDLICCYLF